MTCNGNCNVNGIDRDISVIHIKDDSCKVIVYVLELFRLESHFRRTGVGSLCLRRSAECKVSFGIQRIADFHFVTLCAVLLAIVIDREVVTGDGNGNVDRIDLDIAVSDIEGHVRKVAVCIFELIGVEPHFRFAGVGSYCFGFAAE